MLKKIRVGTRGSKLARTQTQQTIDQLKKKHPELNVEIVEIVTKGDRLVHKSLASIGGQGAFVKEIEHQLIDRTIDLAIHSLKDLPTLLPEELILGSILKRANPFDCLIYREQNQSLDSLPYEAKIGTSSLRRQAQLLRCRPDLQIVPMRGNIDTRIRKMGEQKLDAIVLAVAGIQRMGLTEGALSFEELSAMLCVPAVGQGALALECRKEDTELLNIIKTIEHTETRLSVEAERAFLREMDGSCTFPIGGFAEIHQNQILLTGMIASTDGKEMIQEFIKDTNPEITGKRAAEGLYKKGAKRLIEESKKCTENCYIQDNSPARPAYVLPSGI